MGKRKMTAALGILILLVAWGWTGNNRLTVSRYEVTVGGLDPAFEGFRVAHLSDLHGKWFGRNQDRLIEKVAELRPDIILCTGDMVDSRRYREEPLLALAQRLVSLAPVYMVSGNHEWWIAGGYEALILRLEKLGAAVLENRVIEIERDGTVLRIAGVTDPELIKTGAYGSVEGGGARPGESPTERKIRYMNEKLPGVLGDGDAPVLLLSHRPELFAQYVEHGVDVVFAGHAHGGQVRLPFVGGLVAPGQGVFPRYDAGVFAAGGTAMVVSRGLGNSAFPWRVFNPPDIVLVTLTGESSAGEP